MKVEQPGYPNPVQCLTKRYGEFLFSIFLPILLLQFLIFISGFKRLFAIINQITISCLS